MPDSTHEEFVRQSFHHQVDAFSRRSSTPRSCEGPVGWTESLDPSTLALDVACGAAHTAESLSPFVRQVIGIDLTTELLDVGSARLFSNGIDNVLLQEGNAENLPFLDRTFDLVLCRSSLHHFADPHGAITEMKRVTKPGGRIVLIDLIAPR